MANILLGDQNFADVDYYTPVLSGGSWNTALPLSNLQNEVFSKVARSTNDSESSTRVHADLKVSRDVRLLAACNHNLSRAGAVRFRGSRQIAWSGVTLAASATAGASSVTVECSGGSAMIRAGDSFSLGGTNYTATSDLAIGGNRLADSEDLSASTWATTAASVSANAATAPDGTATADLLTENTANTSHTITHDLAAYSIPNTSSVEVSVFVKPNGTRNLELVLQGPGSDSVSVQYKLSDGTVYAVSPAGLASVSSSGIDTLPDGWFRAWFVCQNGEPGNLVELVAYIANAAFAFSYTGDGSSGLYLWGAQIATGDTLTTYKRSGATPAYQVFSGSVSIAPTLAANQSPGAALTALCGEYVSSAPAADSGWRDVWPVVYPWYLDWEHPSFWDGRLTEEERRTYPKDYIYDIGSTATARYWLVEFSDATNDDGYVQFGRLFVSRGYQPARNYSYDDQFGWEDDTVAVAAVGADYFDERARLRVFTCVIENLEEDEALTYLFETQRRLGKRGQLIVVLDPDETTHWQRKSFIARNVEITPLSNPHFNRHTASLRLKEIRRA